MRGLIAAGIGIAAVSAVLSDGRRLGLALARWDADPSPASLLHVVTSGVLLGTALEGLAIQP